jgi:hypothetical protein
MDMSYFDNEQEYHNRGIDYDLHGCLKYNPQDTFAVGDIDRVLAVWEGDNDGDDWRWILALKDGRFVFLQGGCNYTGWDCLSWATYAFADAPEQAAEHALGNIEVTGNVPWGAGLGHMIEILGGSYMSNAQEVRDSLLAQLATDKVQV